MPTKTKKIKPEHQHADFSRVTPAQMKVVQLVCAGKSDREAAALLGLSENTVGSHRAQAMQRMGCTSVVALTLKAVCAGVLDPCKL
jgi:DNA-binding NarL/FixJ family response regulator